jgi:hypothetical protein
MNIQSPKQKNRTPQNEMFGFCLVYSPWHRSLEPLVVEIQYGLDGEIQIEKTRVFSPAKEVQEKKDTGQGLPTVPNGVSPGKEPA